MVNITAKASSMVRAIVRAHMARANTTRNTDRAALVRASVTARATVERSIGANTRARNGTPKAKRDVRVRAKVVVTAKANAGKATTQGDASARKAAATMSAPRTTVG